MSISSDITIKREKALKIVFNMLLDNHVRLLEKAVNAMSNDELARELHTDTYFYIIKGKAKIDEVSVETNITFK